MIARSLSAGASPHLVNDRVLVWHHGQGRAGRISSIHRHEDGVEYVVRLDDSADGTGTVVNVWSSGARCAVLDAVSRQSPTAEMSASRPRRNWTALARRMGYATTPTQRAQILAAVQRMSWSDCRGVLIAPALRVVAAAVLASAAVERSNKPVADPLRCAIHIGIARLPDGKPLVGLDDGHDRHYLLDLGDEAIYVLIESSQQQASSDVA